MLIPEILTNTNLWFVVGLGNNPDRAAFGVAKFLRDHGKRIVPIYPRAEFVHGEQGFSSIEEAAKVWGPPEVVDLFVNSSRAVIQRPRNRCGCASNLDATRGR